MAVRDEKGLFQKGTTPGPGRPRTQRTDYAKIIRDCLTPQKAYEITERAIQDAVKGDRHARSWVFAHVVAPVPKTTIIDDATIASREVIDSAISKLPVEGIEMVEKLLNEVEKE